MPRRPRVLGWRARQGFDRADPTRPSCRHLWATIKPLDRPLYWWCIYCQAKRTHTPAGTSRDVAR